MSFNWTDYSGGFPQPTVNTALQSAGFNLSVGTVPIPLLGMEALVQATEAVIPIVKARMADAKTVAIQSIATAFYGSAQANTLQIQGLQDAYDDGTGTPVYGGIARAQNPFWKSTINTTAITPTRGSFITQIIRTSSLAAARLPTSWSCPRRIGRPCFKTS